MKSPLEALKGWFSSMQHALGEAATAQAEQDPLALAPTTQQVPDRCASVVIPALNEAARIGYVVQHALSDPATAEVIVIDDSSVDDTVQLARQAGARVITSTMLGKGASMRDGIEAARHEFVVFLDGDLAGLTPGTVSALCGPLAGGGADFVKARFGRLGGRVTELTAKPMLKVFFPELAEFSQPLGGIVAGRRTLLKSLTLEDGYGVDIGLLIDAHCSGAQLREVDIGSLEHDSQPLLDLTAMANEVSRVIHNRARAAGRLHVEQISAMYEAQRQATATIEYILSRRRGRTRVLLLGLDGTVSPARFVQELARVTGNTDAMSLLIDAADEPTKSREMLASALRFVHRQQFERVAHSLPLRPGIVECVNRMRRAGYMVGVVSDGYFIAAEIVRRRIFADFAVAHTLQFDGDVCSGRLHVNAAFLPPDSATSSEPSKHHVVQRFRDHDVKPAVTDIWAVGSHRNDLDMLRMADRAFVVDPKWSGLARESDARRIESFDEIVAAL
jgi:phosphoserine phosphatase